MYEAILASLKEKPLPYTPAEGNIWTEPYLHQQMLQAHLAPAVDAASRNLMFMRRSAQWIATIVGEAAGKQLLDLGCGPGLYAELFDDLGFVVTAVDFSEGSIAYAKKSAAAAGRKIDYLCCDYRQLPFENQFDLVSLIYCDYAALNPTDRALVCREVWRALKPGGLFVLDVFTELQKEGFQESTQVSYADKGFWRDEPYVLLQREFAYKALHAYLTQYLVITAADSRLYHVWDCLFDRDTLGAELYENGFVAFRFYDDVAGAVFTGSSRTLCVIAAKPL